MAMVDLFSRLNEFLDGLRIEPGLKALGTPARPLTNGGAAGPRMMVRKP